MRPCKGVSGCTSSRISPPASQRRASRWTRVQRYPPSAISSSATGAASTQRRVLPPGADRYSEVRSSLGREGVNVDGQDPRLPRVIAITASHFAQLALHTSSPRPTQLPKVVDSRSCRVPGEGKQQGQYVDRPRGDTMTIDLVDPRVMFLSRQAVWQAQPWPPSLSRAGSAADWDGWRTRGVPIQRACNYSSMR